MKTPVSVQEKIDRALLTYVDIDRIARVEFESLCEHVITLGVLLDDFGATLTKMKAREDAE